MPGRDGTGPLGQGPMTGRGLGNCISYGLPLLAGVIAGFCFGRRRGWGNQAGRKSLRGLQRANIDEIKNTNIKEQDS